MGALGWRAECPPCTEAQEEEIAESMVNIQKMQKTQMKCRQVRRGRAGRGDAGQRLGAWRMLRGNGGGFTRPESEGWRGGVLISDLISPGQRGVGQTVQSNLVSVSHVMGTSAHPAFRQIVSTLP